MNVGDLVELSSYGRSLKSYYSGRENDVALIIDQGLWRETYVIQWCSDGKKDKIVSRKDIRYAKVSNR